MASAKRHRSNASAPKLNDKVTWPFSASGYLRRITVPAHIKKRFDMLVDQSERSATGIAFYFIERSIESGECWEIPEGKDIYRKGELPYIGLYCSEVFWDKVCDTAWDINVRRQSPQVMAALCIEQQLGKYSLATWKDFFYNGGDIQDRVNNFINQTYDRAKDSGVRGELQEWEDLPPYLRTNVPIRHPKNGGRPSEGDRSGH